MKMMTRRGRLSLVGVVVAGAAAALVGLTAGNVIAATTGAGTSSAPEPLPEPVYAVNAAGETYGSAGQANTPENEPDLISVIAENGVEGFVRKADLDEANGTTAMRSFTSPQDADRWQKAEGAEDKHIPVYAVDGTTVVGEFVVVGYNTQLEQERKYGRLVDNSQSESTE